MKRLKIDHANSAGIVLSEDTTAAALPQASPSSSLCISSPFMNITTTDSYVGGSGPFLINDMLPDDVLLLILGLLDRLSLGHSTRVCRR